MSQQINRNIPLDTDNEDQLGLVSNVEATLLLAQTSKADLLALSIAVLLDVGLGALENDGALLLVGLFRFDCQHLAAQFKLQKKCRQVEKVSVPKDG